MTRGAFIASCQVSCQETRLVTHQISIPCIETDPAVLGGKPTIAGTRIGVELILEKIGDGETIDEILRDYPRLSREQVLAAIRYAVELVRGAGA